jgi:hypothetical protein
MGAAIDCFGIIEESLQNCFKGVALRFGKLLKIEELDRSAVLDEDKVITGLSGSTIIALMRESQQMLAVIKFCGYYMLILTLIYLAQTIY